jgi:hypothetical protein
VCSTADRTTTFFQTEAINDVDRICSLKGCMLKAVVYLQLEYFIHRPWKWMVSGELTRKSKENVAISQKNPVSIHPSPC